MKTFLRIILAVIVTYLLLTYEAERRGLNPPDSVIMVNQPEMKNTPIELDPKLFKPDPEKGTKGKVKKAVHDTVYVEVDPNDIDPEELPN